MRAVSDIALTTSDVLEIVSSTDKGANADPKARDVIENWISTKSASYQGGSGRNALTDSNIFGNYDVAFVGSGPNQRGNPAGGRYRGRLGRFLYKNEGLYQHILMPEKLDGKIAVINYVRGKLLNTIPFGVILRGFATETTAEERCVLTQRYGTPLSPATVRADFEPPVLCFGNLNSYRGSLRVGPKSSVVLDTPYVCDKIRLGVGSRGSTFIFTRTTDPAASAWKEWLALKPLSAKKAGAALVSFGLLTLFGLSNARIVDAVATLGKLFGGVVALFGCLLLVSKGGIVD